MMEWQVYCKRNHLASLYELISHDELGQYIETYEY